MPVQGFHLQPVSHLFFTFQLKNIVYLFGTFFGNFMIAMLPIIKRLQFCFFALLFPVLAPAQAIFYQHDASVKVFAYGNEQTMAWCGGFNNPQFTMGDLNRDGLQDLVVFEPWNSVRAFINMGSPGSPDYRYAPEYANKFPPVFNYLILSDYNCDGVPDLFNHGSTGFEVYRGYYNGHGQLRFTYYQKLFYSNDEYSGGWANAFNNPGDIPSIVDVDNDGDLDYVAYDIAGGTMKLYKDMRVEHGLPCDSIRIALKDRCWGRVYQGFYRTHQLGYSCDNTHLLRLAGGKGGKLTHSGNTPCLFDWDMDGDYDYLDGNVSFNEMTFLKNGRIEKGSGPDSAISQDTMWQAGGKVIDIPMFPAAFNIDIDQDGKKDLLVAPNAPGNYTENAKGVWFYKNYSTPGVPDWRFQSDSFLTNKLIDLGAASYPMFFDYDKDGKPDLFVGSDGYYQSGTLRSRLSYYLNTSTGGSASYTLQTTDFMGLDAMNFRGTAPATGDIDDDGKADLVLGHVNGSLSYYKNMAASDAVTPDWQLVQLYLTDMNGDTINTGGFSAPFIYDIDRDGKKDLIIGNIYGYIEYYQNVSTVPGTISLKLVNKQLGQAKVDSPRTFGCYSAPFIGRIDSSGTEYLMVGSGTGHIYQFTGFQSGDTTARYTLLDARYAYIDTTFSIFSAPTYGCYDGLRSTVAVGDVNSDSNYYMVVGNNKGGLELYKRKVYYPIPEKTGVDDMNEHASVLVYPNPVADVLHVKWSGVAQPEVRITFANMTGQVLYTASVPSTANSTAIDVSMLPPGMYVCVLQSGVNRYYSKFTVVK